MTQYNWRIIEINAKEIELMITDIQIVNPEIVLFVEEFLTFPIFNVNSTNIPLIELSEYFSDSYTFMNEKGFKLYQNALKYKNLSPIALSEFKLI